MKNRTLPLAGLALVAAVALVWSRNRKEASAPGDSGEVAAVEPSPDVGTEPRTGTEAAEGSGRELVAQDESSPLDPAQPEPTWEDIEPRIRKLAIEYWERDIEVRRRMLRGFHPGPVTAAELRETLQLSDATNAEQLAAEINARNADIDAQLASLAESYITGLDTAYRTLVEEGSYEYREPGPPPPPSMPGPEEASTLERIGTLVDGWHITVRVRRDRFPNLGAIADLQEPLFREQSRNFIAAIQPYRATEPNSKFWPSH